MSNSNDQENKGFLKKAHRPWKSQLLEETAENAEFAVKDPMLEKDGADAFAKSLDSLYADFSIGDEDPINNKFSQLEAVNPSSVEKTLTDYSSPSTSITMGGFFSPENMSLNLGTDNGKKISALMTDLKNKEQKLNSLTSDLKLSEASEKVEQAELARKAEEQARISAEKRMRKAVEQAHLAAEQFHVAMEQARQAEEAQKEEARIRKYTEAQVNEAKIRYNKVLQEMEDLKQALKEAEEKAQHALSQTVEVELSKQKLQDELSHVTEQLQDTTSKLRKVEMSCEAEEASRTEAENKYHNLNKVFTKIDCEHKENLGKIYSLENELKNLKANHERSETELEAAKSQRDKLKDIVQSEQDLRKLAEKRMKDALLKAANAEKSLHAAEEQKKLTDERAKRAVAHASKTIMQFLDGTEDIAQVEEKLLEKKKIKVKAPTSDEDPFSF